MEKNTQMWLIPEVGESVEDFRKREIAKISEPEVYQVPNITMDEEARKELPNWPLEISSKRIVINKPFAHYAELEPNVLFDFKDIEVTRVEFKMKGRNCAEMKLYLKNGKILQEQLILHDNGKVENIWGQNNIN
ncbi:MAG TPA: hypothetical protein VGO21_05410 [Candidatus Paceibacterota bacterium]|jgi:hypothetical protein|nr:hypothetical protein [Candidatus Paceibacterota bacterium]